MSWGFPTYFLCRSYSRLVPGLLLGVLSGLLPRMKYLVKNRGQGCRPLSSKRSGREGGGGLAPSKRPGRVPRPPTLVAPFGELPGPAVEGTDNLGLQAIYSYL